MSNPLLDLITQGESGTAGYNAYNRGTYIDADGKAHIRSAHEPIDFSQMTLGQVLDQQHAPRNSPDKLLAVGKYQIIPDTMSDAARKLQLDRNQPFTPELQDKIFSQYLIVDKRPAVHDYITGQPGASLHEAQADLASEWASFGDPNKGGASHYPPPNHASITLAQSEHALNQMRTDYQADIAKGMTPAAAWQAVTGSDGAPSRTEPANKAADHARDQSHGVHVLVQGAHGAAVSKLQDDLAELGYKDAKGHPLKADGVFGIDTRHAVEKFQADHHLTVDGKVGPATERTLNASLKEHAKEVAKAPDLADPKNPDHKLYEQALAGVHKIDAEMGRTPDQHSTNLAAALTVAAKAQGLTRIDTVVLSEDGSRTFAAQNTSPLKTIAQVSTAQAVNTPMEKSSIAAQAVQPMPTAIQAPPLPPHPQQVPQPTSPTLSL
jgi:peptidoglycan hydrolase-like protein with peptidoglycan-binding domain